MNLKLMESITSCVDDIFHGVRPSSEYHHFSLLLFRALFAFSFHGLFVFFRVLPRGGTARLRLEGLVKHSHFQRIISKQEECLHVFTFLVNKRVQVLFTPLIAFVKVAHSIHSCLLLISDCRMQYKHRVVEAKQIHQIS
jgi:hypothetical protein